MMDNNLTDTLEMSSSELTLLAAYLGLSCSRVRARIREGRINVIKLPSGGVRVVITNQGQGLGNG